MADWISLFRVRQWTKNLLVFIPLVFAFRLTSPESFLSVTILFVSFSMVSTGVYIINDLKDRENDRLHPLKQNRPIARGVIKPAKALVVCAIFLTVGLAISYLLLPIGTLYILLSYLVLQGFYNGALRSVAGADVIVIALGFVLRAVSGAVAIDVLFSEWLLICTFFGAARIAIGKRQSEVQIGKTGLRKGWEEVSPDEMRSIGGLTSGVLLIVYTLYCFDSHTATLVGEMERVGILSSFPPLFLSLPFVYFGILRYEILANRAEAGEPEFLIFNDAQLRIALFGWLAVSFAALYLWPRMG